MNNNDTEHVPSALPEEPVKWLRPRVYGRGSTVACVFTDETGCRRQIIYPIHHEGPFELAYRQSRAERAIYRQALWFNGEGQWLGLGDLDWLDLRRIATTISPHETFIICRRDALTLSELQARASNPNLRAITDIYEVAIRKGTEGGELFFSEHSILADFFRQVNEEYDRLMAEHHQLHTTGLLANLLTSRKNQKKKIHPFVSGVLLGDLKLGTTIKLQKVSVQKLYEFLSQRFVFPEQGVVEDYEHYYPDIESVESLPLDE